MHCWVMNGFDQVLHRLKMDSLVSAIELMFDMKVWGCDNHVFIVLGIIFWKTGVHFVGLFQSLKIVL